MSGQWNLPGIPHRCWQVFDVEDNGAGNYESCAMCDNHRVRYIHLMKHPEYDGVLRVGCICAEKMVEGYDGRSKELELKRRNQSRERWLFTGWKESGKGNLYRNVNNHNVCVFPDHFRKCRWKYKIDTVFSKRSYAGMHEAMLAAYDFLFSDRRLLATD
jgi:hypothetical protein